MKSRRSFLGYLGIAPLAIPVAIATAKAAPMSAKVPMLLIGESGPEMVMPVKPGMVINPCGADATSIRAIEDTIVRHVRALQRRRAL